ncbi:MAG: hypothetical protein ACE37K_13355 [Planctomycetota bacterium]
MTATIDTTCTENARASFASSLGLVVLPVVVVALLAVLLVLLVTPEGMR